MSMLAHELAATASDVDEQIHIPILPVIDVPSGRAIRDHHKHKFIGFPIRSIDIEGHVKVITVSGENFACKQLLTDTALVESLDFALYTFYFIYAPPVPVALRSVDELPHIVDVEFLRCATSEEAADRFCSRAQAQ